MCWLRVIFAIVSGGSALAFSPQQSGSDPPAAQVVQSLADIDPQVRDLAAEKLVRMGEPARQELLDATRSPDPELSASAARVLMKLPWYLPNDSPQARTLLKDYGSLPDPRRIDVVTHLINLQEDEALIRLLEQDPSDTVRWAAVHLLRPMRLASIAPSLRELSLETDNTALLTLAAHAWLELDRGKAMKIFARVIDLERSRPTDDQDELLVAFTTFIGQTMKAKEYEMAAELLRQQAQRGYGVESARPALHLFALHDAVGPLPGFASDVHRFGDLAERPTLLDQIAILQEQFAALPRIAGPWGQLAKLRLEQRYEMGEFLGAHGFRQAAKQQMQLVLHLAERSAIAGTEPAKPRVEVCNAHFRLAGFAVADADDFAAAEHLRQAMEVKQQIPGAQLVRSDDDVWTEVHWRYLRAYHARRDEPAMLRQVEKLRTLAATNSDIVLEVMQTLTALGHDDVADTLFDQSYKKLNASIPADSPNPQDLNNLAWLGARSGKRVAEAITLSEQALELAGDVPAFLDTAAEAHFRAGNAKKAIELETRALELRPGDQFMMEQLERFKAGGTK